MSTSTPGDSPLVAVSRNASGVPVDIVSQDPYRDRHRDPVPAELLEPL